MDANLRYQYSFKDNANETYLPPSSTTHQSNAVRFRLGAFRKRSFLIYSAIINEVQYFGMSRTQHIRLHFHQKHHLTGQDRYQPCTLQVLLLLNQPRTRSSSYSSDTPSSARQPPPTSTKYHYHRLIPLLQASVTASARLRHRLHPYSVYRGSSPPKPMLRSADLLYIDICTFSSVAQPSRSWHRSKSQILLPFPIARACT